MDIEEIGLSKLLEIAVEEYVRDSLNWMNLADVRNVTGVTFDDKKEVQKELARAIKHYKVKMAVKL